MYLNKKKRIEIKQQNELMLFCSNHFRYRQKRKEKNRRMPTVEKRVSTPDGHFLKFHDIPKL